MELDTLESIVVIVGGVLLYVLLRMPGTVKQYKMGLLMFAYVRDITALLTKKLLTDWHEFPIPDKLEMLKAVYDIIANFDAAVKPKEKELESNISEIQQIIMDGTKI